MLKGLLTTYGVEPEEQHNLGRLVSQLHKLDRTTAEAISDVGTLTPFAVIHRYPPRMPSGFSGPSREDAVEAVKIARKACQVLESAVALRIAPDFRQSPESEAQ
jgi:HEPN domain-containing protein